MRSVRDQFRAAELENPGLDARLLAAAAFGLEGAALAINENQPAEEVQLQTLATMAARRLKGEPVARILGEKEFYGLVFKLNAASLVPRPETELLVELGLKHLPTDRPSTILDLGTGSGCIAIALLKNLPQAQALGVDLSEEALLQANENAHIHGVDARFSTRMGSWYGPVDAHAKLDLIVANPPYIAAREILGLDIEVSAYDPILALSAGTDGLEPYGPIIKGAEVYLQPNGALAMECGVGQADQIKAMCIEAGFANVSIHDDLAGIPRVVVAIS